MLLAFISLALSVRLLPPHQNKKDSFISVVFMLHSDETLDEIFSRSTAHLYTVTVGRGGCFLWKGQDPFCRFKVFTLMYVVELTFKVLYILVFDL